MPRKNPVANGTGEIKFPNSIGASVSHFYEQRAGLLGRPSAPMELHDEVLQSNFVRQRTAGRRDPHSAPREGGLMSSSPLALFDDMLTEEQVCERYSRLLSSKELREARRKGEITFVKGKKGQISYHPAWVVSYLNRKITRCHRPQDDSGNMGGIGSAASLAPTTFTPAGGTNDQHARVAEALKRKFLPKPKSA
jgi:hypothetical protein